MSRSESLKILDQVINKIEPPPPYDNKNIFKQILEGNIPCFKIFENDSCLAILDAFPMCEGHSLLISKVCKKSLEDFTSIEAANYLSNIPKLVKIVKNATKATAVNIISNLGKDAGQAVYHAHVHIIPRFTNDNLIKLPQSSKKMLSKENAMKILSKMCIETKQDLEDEKDDEISVEIKNKITLNESEALKKEIKELIINKNCGPILVRLAWHDSGTYCTLTKTGGPRAAQRFKKGESKHGANAGLDIARELLKPIKKKYCDKGIISISDLWAFAGNVAIETLNGPMIEFRFGRKDIKTYKDCVKDGRLPDAKQGIKHIRNVFNRIGFKEDKYIVALSGAHTLGSCHENRSGFNGPWTDNPFIFDNSYFKDLIKKKWDINVSKKGNTQFVCGKTMMLPTDWVLQNNSDTRKIVEKYAENQKEFFNDFSIAWKRLIESGYSDQQLYKPQ